MRHHAPDDLCLTLAIESQARDFQDRSGVDCHLTADPRLDSVDFDRSTDVLWVVQEALTNVARHARATRVEVVIERQKENLCLSVKDNGRGIGKKELSDPATFGILGMKERMYPWGGRLKVHGRKGKGTKIEVSLPLR